MSAPLSPEPPPRHQELDTLRGVALLGILLMNSISFAMPFAAYYNPLSYQPSALNTLIYSLLHILADQKFMNLFALLFGAGVLLFCQNRDQRGEKVLGLFYWRYILLLGLGWTHLTYFWIGDILTVYAVCAFIIFWCRKWPAWLQFSLGFMLYGLMLLSFVGVQSAIPSLDYASHNSLEQIWAPEAQILNQEVQLYRSNYSTIQAYLATLGISSNDSTTLGQDLYDITLFLELLGRSLAMMLIGMAFLQWGILTGQRSEVFYQRCIFWGLGLGLPLALGGVLSNFYLNWHWSWSLSAGRLPNHLAAPLLSLAYLAWVIRWAQNQHWPKLHHAVTGLGRIALSGYLFQTLCGCLIFYGYGLGLFGALNRLELLGFTLGVWLLELYFATLWLHYFQIGPVEWLWRSLTYFKLQPLRQASLRQG